TRQSTFSNTFTSLKNSYMLKSMTGFGRSEKSVGDKTFLVDIKSLNGKQFELQLKLPAFLKPFEFEVRRILSSRLGRGSVDCTISLKETGNAKPVTINIELAKAYYKPLAALSGELNLDPSHILSTLVKLPEVITPTSETLTDDEWKAFEKVIITAIDDLNIHRDDEGKSLEKDLLQRISNILVQLEEVQKLEPQRKLLIRDDITKLMEEYVGKENYDKNRLEQELIYYFEKIDISEEIVRLKNHCDYFRIVLAEAEESKGKKLSFILQEIGREINTTGAKAYDATIQKYVVMMKDELEKAKEQVLNVL
ncbi:MAG TPA: YicC/YloC family endoribonuclease, partial [Chitinophagaceae bacterium]|nr:YicC/YloC family endoribonuclease [Chitinophagaceae bacterium]